MIIWRRTANVEVLAFIVTILAGYLGSALGWKMNWPEAGPIAAIAIIGSIILWQIRHPKDQNQKADKEESA